MTVRFGSVCSGIEAASVAWHPLSWQAAWLCEIEPFPCAVLAHHYPSVPNYGDMTALPERIRSGEIEAPDLFCGGTPCQAFSVAGNRRSLDDARGNLSLTFCEIANAIDDIRTTNDLPPTIVFWENVPGVLRTKDNAFGCFLAGLAGEDVALEPPGGKWTDAGFVFGPTRNVAWRILDAQYFGLAQRRKRVFVVASARAGFNPATVLFEFDGVQRHTPPSREAGQAVAGDVNKSVVGALCARDYKGISADNAAEGKCVLEPVYNIIADVTPKITNEIAGTLRADGGGGIVPSSVAYAIQGSMIGRAEHNGPQGDGINEEVSFTQNCTDRHAVPVTYAVRRLTPVECARLQGFPDTYLDVPFRGKPAGDGVKYKALGNSWAVNVVSWLGNRIQEAL